MRRAPPRAALLAACLAAAALARPAVALDWPVRKTVLTATFGEDRTDHFHNGIDLGGGRQDVLAVLPGELVFRSDEEADYTSVPRGVGTFAALRHADGIGSVYCHLENGSVDAGTVRYAAGEKLGVMGDSGYSEGTHLHFIVLDSQTSSFVNPLALLPPLSDRQPPVVRRVSLAVGDRVMALEQGGQVPPGRVEVRAELFDPRADVVARLAFDALHVSEGRTLLRGTPLTAGGVWTADGLVRLGAVELRPGSSRLLVTARDFAGNEVSRDIAFTVRE